MKTARQNAARIRGGAKLLLAAAAAAGAALVVQMLGQILQLTYSQLQGLVQLIDLTVAASFVAAGVGLWLAFTGIAEELEAGD